MKMSGGAGWSVTKKDFENVEYTYKWHIENFDFAMETEKGKIESSSFYIPGVPGEFKMMVLKKECKFGSGRSYSHKMPEKVILRGQEGHLTVEIKHLFSFFLKSTESNTRAAAKVEVTQEGKDTLCGKFGDSSAHKFLNPLQFHQTLSDYRYIPSEKVGFRVNFDVRKVSARALIKKFSRRQNQNFGPFRPLHWGKVAQPSLSDQKCFKSVK